MDATEIEIAWLAGLYEGEGSFMTYLCKSNGREYTYVKAVVTMTDRDVVARVAKILGRNLQQIKPSQDNRKISYRATVTGKHAVELMQAILPHMGKRRSKKIRELIAIDAQRGDPNEKRREWSMNRAAERERDKKGRLV